MPILFIPSRRRPATDARGPSRKVHGTEVLRRALYVRGLMAAGMTHAAALRDWIAFTGDPIGADHAEGGARDYWHRYERTMAAAHRRSWRALGVL